MLSSEVPGRGRDATRLMASPSVSHVAFTWCQTFSEKATDVGTNCVFLLIDSSEEFFFGKLKMFGFSKGYFHDLKDLESGSVFFRHGTLSGVTCFTQ